MQLIKLDLHNKLLLTVNKRINKYPHAKINDKMGSSLNQSITYNFSKNTVPYISSQNKNIFNYTAINSSARIGITNYVLKIINSFFNSLYCIIAKPQFINKHDKLIIRIPYYQNNVQKNSLFTNTNSNYIYNSLINNNSINITKNSIVKWLKDYLNLNIDKLNNNIIDLNTIDNYIKNDKIIDNKLLNNNNSQNIISNKKTKLLTRIADANSFDYLNTKRLSNLKIASNKLLMLKIIKNLNYHNEKSTEILGKGSILNPVTTNTLDKLFGGVYDSKGYLGDVNFINDYKLISTNLMATNLINNNNIKNAYSKEIDTLNKLSKNNLMTNLKLINNINKKLLNLKSQFANKNNESINFILNNIIKQLNPNILFYNTLINNNKNNNIVKLLMLNRQLSLINKLGLNLSNNNNTKLLLNIKIIKLIVKNNIILANSLNNNSNNITTTVNTNNNLNNLYSNISSIIVSQFKNNNNNTNNDILINKIKETYLAFNYYNNKSNNNNNLLKNNIIKFKLLGNLLSNIFKKNISIELIRLWNVGLEPTILSQIISKNSVTDKSSVIFKKLWKKIVINQANKLISARQNNLLEGNNLVYNNINKLGINNNIKLLSENKANLKFIQVNDFINNINTYNSNPITLAKTVGLSIKIGGRLSRERIQPKRTVKQITVGSVKGDKTKVIDSYQYTNKNKRGAFTISIKMCHARN